MVLIGRICVSILACLTKGWFCWEKLDAGHYCGDEWLGSLHFWWIQDGGWAHERMEPPAPLPKTPTMHTKNTCARCLTSGLAINSSTKRVWCGISTRADRVEVASFSLQVKKVFLTFESLKCRWIWVNQIQLLQSLWGPFMVSQSLTKRHFPLELVHGSVTTCIPLNKKKGVNLTLKVHIPNPTRINFKFPTLWKEFHVKFPTPRVGKMVKWQGYTRGRDV